MINLNNNNNSENLLWRKIHIWARPSTKQKDCLNRASVLSAVHCLIAGIPAAYKALHYYNKTSLQTIQIKLYKHVAGVYIDKINYIVVLEPKCSMKKCVLSIDLKVSLDFA